MNLTDYVFALRPLMIGLL